MAFKTFDYSHDFITTSIINFDYAFEAFYPTIILVISVVVHFYENEGAAIHVS